MNIQSITNIQICANVRFQNYKYSAAQGRTLYLFLAYCCSYNTNREQVRRTLVTRTDLCFFETFFKKRKFTFCFYENLSFVVVWKVVFENQQFTFRFVETVCQKTKIYPSFLFENFFQTTKIYFFVV